MRKKEILFYGDKIYKEDAVVKELHVPNSINCYC